ncbi:hypothetical protein AGMMS49975_25840 [Clostridia bacterium]|nr:hypothetical protein AGMMS49975_25840 [Clostridia bacterium]
MKISDIKKIGIVGLGLIGGSLAKALRRELPEIYIHAFDANAESLSAAFSEGAVQGYSAKIDGSFRACDIVFICVPATLIPEYAEKLSKIVQKECIITDTGSAKKRIF